MRNISSINKAVAFAAHYQGSELIPANEAYGIIKSLLDLGMVRTEL